MKLSDVSSYTINKIQDKIFNITWMNMKISDLFPGIVDNGMITQLSAPEQLLEYQVEALQGEVNTLKTLPAAEGVSLKKKFKQKLEKLRENAKSGTFVRSLDKVIFTFHVMRLILGFFIMGRWPQHFPYYHSIFTILSMIHRFIDYKPQNLHYFMLDFCYFVNTILIIYILYLPHNRVLFLAIYAFTNGSVLLSVPIFHTSLVFHSTDKAFSNYMHAAPAMVLWLIRISDVSQHYTFVTNPGILEYLWSALCIYTIWASFYTFFVIWLLRDYVERHGLMTLYKYGQSNPKYRTYKFCGLLGERFRPLMFIFQHFCTMLGGAIIAYCSIFSAYTHTFWVALFGVWSVWNSAHYYLEIFAKTYEVKIQELDNINKDLENQSKRV